MLFTVVPGVAGARKLCYLDASTPGLSRCVRILVSWLPLIMILCVLVYHKRHCALSLGLFFKSANSLFWLMFPCFVTLLLLRTIVSVVSINFLYCVVMRLLYCLLLFYRCRHVALTDPITICHMNNLWCYVVVKWMLKLITM